jgi:Tol biopolymer transport system component
VALMVAIAVLGGNGGVFSDGETLPPSLAVDRIAFVDLDRRIMTVAPDGLGAVAVSPEGDERFTWPTWSPDGRRLVFSGLRGQEGQRQPVLYAANTVTGELRELHSGEPGTRILVAEDAPHYPYWSPDGNRLAFIAVSSQGLQLYLDDIRDDAGPRLVLSDGPLWISWSPDSRRLLVHRGVDHFMIDVETAQVSSLPIYSDRFGFRVPSWTMSGDKITYVAGDSYRGYTLYIADPEGIEGAPVRDVSDNTAFLWSKDGLNLAVARRHRMVPFHSDLRLVVYESISVVRPDGSAVGPDIEANVVAFFWSPDSTMLAYVTLGEEPGVLRWNVRDVLEGTDQRLIEFRPSADQLTVFRYFDQYAPSHSQWSPRSTDIVFAGRLVGTSISASVAQQQPDQIIVVSVPPRLTVDVVAEGSLGFWSPR